jgi:UDP-N-acetylmuramate dehydrogenase
VGKGFRKGQVGTYDQQALVIVHYGGANGDQIREFAEFIQSEVSNMFGIFLEAEVRIISAISDDD